ncbi:DNA polymerase iota [Chironomus tepperi]|uniref:DNA polymerase iota n=1 Tax=Chironomus tepperi TaxID=113505 RepID=UPI00391F7283
MEQDEEFDISSDQKHLNVIIHLDIDYFYAQVEEILNPELKNKPLGVRQGLSIVTCNYLAREHGVGKWKPLKECIEKCPELVIVNGEDLTNYKVYSKRVSELLHKMFGTTERMGLDEHYIDITKEIERQLTELDVNEHHFVGPIYPDEETFNQCNCGCKTKLMLGTEIADRVRKRLYEDLKLTCSIGIAHNKLLAKLVGTMNKPNNQTALAPTASKVFMADLKNLRSITGIGEKTAARIQELGIQTVADLQDCDIQRLQKKFGIDMATRLKEMSLGIDTSEIKATGKPKTVGLEDSFRPISIRSDAAEKFQALLSRLMIQIQDDGRIPQSIKVTVRKYDPVKKNSIRETKQCALAPSLFRCVDGKIQLTEGAEQKIIKNVLMLFDRMVDLKQQFNITLLGLCFSKFQEQKKGPGSIANYLMKKQDVEVQSITNLSNETINGSLSDSFRSKTASPSSSLMDFETLSNNSLDLSGSSETELEPSPKKRKKLNLLLVARNRRYSSNDDIASPSKLNVSDLHLNGTSMDTSTPTRIISPLCKNPEPIACSSTKQTEIPPNIDPSVWQELPLEVQRELMMNWQTTASNATNSTIPSSHHSKTRLSSTKTNNNTLHKYFVQNS